MQITNKAGLPAPLVAAVTRHPRPRRPNTISVSELIQPPQIRALTQKHYEGLTEDAADRIWALLGTLMHAALEGHAKALPNVISEEELSMPVLGWTLIGHYDLSESDTGELVLDDELLTDYKLTSVYAIKQAGGKIGAKPEWEAQLNTYAHLIRRADRNLRGIQIVAIGRDWSRIKSIREYDYPKKQVQVFPVPLWEPDRAQAFIEERVRLHQEAEKGNWPDCTPEERWAKPTIYALMKKGQKRAVKLFETPAAAEFARAKNQYVVIRPGESTRCEMYCAVAPHCPQFASIQAAKTKNETQEEE
jgi:hypothetical protein